jgi:hypothetical protein
MELFMIVSTSGSLRRFVFRRPLAQLTLLRTIALALS